jgi:hypothetical protein
LEPASYLAEDREEGWRNDLNYIVDTFDTCHSNPYLETTQQSFNAAVADLDAAVPSLTDNEIKLEFSKLVASVGDAHTRIWLTHSAIGPFPDWFDGAFDRAQMFGSYPIRVYWFSDGLYVVGSTTEHRDTLGTKVVQIGEHSPDEVMDLIRPYISHSVDEWMIYQSPKFLVSPEALHVLGVIDDVSSAQYSFQDSDGSTFQVSLSPFDRSLVSAEEVDMYNHGSMLSPPGYDQNPLWESALAARGVDAYPLYLRDPFSFYWFEHIQQENAVYFQFNAVANDPQGKRFRPFFDDMIKFVDKNGVDTLIIDLRFNNGGNYTIPEPKWEELGRHRLNQDGRIHVLIGRNTFSAAVVSAHLIEEHTNAQFFGEGVGDPPEMYYTSVGTTLPNSELLFTFAQCHEIFPDLSEQLLPNVAVSMSSGDYLSGSDPVLDAALAR